MLKENLNRTLGGLKNNSNQTLSSFLFSLSLFGIHFVASYKGAKWKFGIFWSMTLYNDFPLFHFPLETRVAMQYVPTVWGWINLPNLELVTCEILISIMSKMSVYFWPVMGHACIKFIVTFCWLFWFENLVSDVSSSKCPLPILVFFSFLF